jgi:hypothetical protein
MVIFTTISNVPSYMREVQCNFKKVESLSISTASCYGITEGNQGVPKWGRVLLGSSPAPPEDQGA